MSWEMVVGLEVHVQLLTRTKLFCNCSTDFGAAPPATSLEAGDLKGRRIGTQWRVPKAAVEAFFKS